ncbi:thioredoxin family protein [Arenibacter palladensis]|uniref:thioredoxin family protein n=1 Tax=Arenibacter palladensis TaxID=237373 RepID=UPI0026E15CF1|nr:thioredoxin domain-containing protein [Arenibacter palladensis]MDO6604164.1 thioredoxin domain-containing protein [Arenibacter palladensis]
MKKKLTIWMFVCLFNVVSSITYAQANTAIQWISFEQLHDSLKVHPKKVFIDFYADWCASCLKMDEIAFKDAKVIHKLNNDYYAVKMNVETTDTIVFGQQSFINKRANKRNPVHEIPLLLASRKDAPFTLPAMVLMDSKFNAQARYFQYLDAEQLLAILEKMP